MHLALLTRAECSGHAAVAFPDGNCSINTESVTADCLEKALDKGIFQLQRLTKMSAR